MFFRRALQQRNQFVRYASAESGQRQEKPSGSISSYGVAVLGVALLTGGAYYAFRNFCPHATPLESGLSDLYLVMEREKVLSPSEWRSFTFKSGSDENHNTRRLRFAFDEPTKQVLGMQVASCLIVKTNVEGEDEPVIRPYTPITLDSDNVGHFDLVVKRYEQGKASRVLTDLKPGDTVEFKGPFKKIDITTNKVKHMTMLAGGTGITPMYQVLRQVLGDADDRTEITLVFANRTEDDVMLKCELDALQTKHADRFTIQYVYTQPKNDETKRGYINAEHIRSVTPPPSEASQLVFVCGPTAFYESICGAKNPDKSQGPLAGQLKELGYSEEQVFKF
jgi:cytochrome-b5 reductase